ncbi:MAG: U32 family peptidase [Clostridia bacterium]
MKFASAGANEHRVSLIHGALCYRYSGRCLMSSLIGGG